jgi:hypothetical protein
VGNDPSEYKELSSTDIDRMKYYYKELADLAVKYPNSLCVRNGMVHIEKVCGLPKVTKPIDPLTVLPPIEYRSFTEEFLGK